MTQKLALELLPVIEAFANGRPIEVDSKTHPTGWKNSDMFPVCGAEFENLNWKWRIKPTKQFRTWRLEEVPVGAVIKHEIGTKFSILYANEFGILIHFKNTYGRFESLQIGYTTLFALYKYSTDFGKTWLPCGVEE